jgi:hypothetical protein
VDLRLCDVLWVLVRRGVEVPDPSCEEDRRRHSGGHAPDQLGCCGFGHEVQGPVHWVHQDGHPVDPPRKSASATPVELRAASRRSAIGRLIAVLCAGGGA